jgi:hypothetical protein
MAKVVMMGMSTPPYFCNEGGDLSISDSLEEMAGRVEATDVEHGVFEFMDAVGRPIEATLEGRRVVLRLLPDASPNPQRLEGLLRRFFSRLPKKLEDYASRADAASSLEELVALRRHLTARHRSPRW